MPAADPAVLRCTSTADFLAVLPFVTGFTDEQSLFIVLFRGKRSEDVLRLELPEHLRRSTTEAQAPSAASGASRFSGVTAVTATTAPPTSHDRARQLREEKHTERLFVDAVIELLRATGVAGEGPAFVFTTTLSYAQCDGVPLLRLTRMLQRRLRAEGWRARELAVIASDGWSALLSDTPHLRHDLTEIMQSPMASQAGVHVDTPRTLRELGELPPYTPMRATQVAAAIEELSRREHNYAALKQSEAPAPAQTADDWVPTETDSLAPIWVRGLTRVCDRCFDTAEADAEIDPRMLARLIFAAQSPDRWLAVALTALTREEFVMSLAESNGTRLFGKLPVSADERSPGSIEDILLSLAEEIPDTSRLGRVATVLADATVHAPRAAQPAMLSLLAWVWWSLGMQSVATVFIEQARAVDPAHAVSEMVSRLIQRPPQMRLRHLQAARRQAAA
ncbi:MAG: DUF4192 family protein [Leucobacter sp.]|nr:DUF4192 family protein [Leucobacter sp.]